MVITLYFIVYYFIFFYTLSRIKQLLLTPNKNDLLTTNYLESMTYQATLKILKVFWVLGQKNRGGGRLNRN